MKWTCIYYKYSGKTYCEVDDHKLEILKLKKGETGLVEQE